jgi:hypothetical protein
MWINDNRGTVRAQPVVPGPPRQILPGKTAIQAKREAGPIIRMAVMISRKSVIMGTLLAMSFAGIKRPGEQRRNKTASLPLKIFTVASASCGLTRGQAAEPH